jgi:hypothetical protein
VCTIVKTTGLSLKKNMTNCTVLLPRHSLTLSIIQVLLSQHRSEVLIPNIVFCKYVTKILQPEGAFSALENLNIVDTSVTKERKAFSV